MLNKFNIDEIAERFINNALSPKEEEQLLKAINEDPILKKEWEEALAVYQALNHAADVAHIKNTIEAINKAATPTFQQKTIKFVRKNWKNAAVAASVFFAAITTYNYFESSSTFGNKLNSFTQLSRDVEHIKISQNNLIKTIEDHQKEDREESGLGGTGFAITNDGYIATNYHVIDQSSHIYITTNENKTYKADVVGYDALKDIAILKINDQQFKFGKQNLPYSLIDKKDKVLGLKVFTIGYPQENLVYNEGYISAELGYENDSLSYQLEIVANPGQSGSPILDGNGNVLGLINGKKSNSTGTTYAVQSKALMELIKSLPDHIKIPMSKTNNIAKMNRPEQVDVLKQYVVTVKSTK